MGSYPNGPVPKVVRIGFAFTLDLADPIPFGSAICTCFGSLLKMVSIDLIPKGTRVKG